MSLCQTREGSNLWLETQSDSGYEGQNISLLSQETIDGVEKFVLFAGYARSGSSIVGSMLDAHPSVIIAHEYYLFKRWVEHPSRFMNKTYLYNELYLNSYMSAMEGWRTHEADMKGYSLEMDGLWQGRFDKLRIIGDKTAGDTADHYFQHSLTSSTKYITQLQQTVNVPLRVIHMVRNPYDLIATAALYEHNTKSKASKEHRFNNMLKVYGEYRTVFHRAKAVLRMSTAFQMKVLDVHLVDLVRDPKKSMQIICGFLELECSEDYLQKCQEKTFHSLSKSRDVIVWPPGLRTLIEMEKDKLPFFRRYSFNKD